MFRLHLTCNDASLGELIALLAKTGKVTNIKHEYTPGSVEIVAKAPAPVATAERPKPEPERKTRDASKPSLQALARDETLDFVRKHHFRRVEKSEIVTALNAATDVDQQRITWALSALIEDGLIVRAERGKYELSPDELARYKIAHLLGGTNGGTQPEAN